MIKEGIKVKSQRVVCQICGKKLKALSYNHLITHDISSEKYKRKYKVEFLTTSEVRRKIKIANRGNKFALGLKHTEKFKERVSEKNKELWRDPMFRREVIRKQKKFWTKQKRFLISRLLKIRLGKPEVRLKMSKAALKNWKDAKYVKKIKESREYPKMHF